MPVNSLSQYLREQMIVKESDLQDLRGTKLAVDAHHWLKEVVAPRFNEPWHSVMSGIPLTFEKVIDEEIKRFTSHDIWPVFVFNGVSVCRWVGQAWERHVQTHTTDLYAKREEAWQKYKTGDFQSAKRAFANASSGSVVTSTDFLAALLAYFRKKGTQFCRAPYLSWPQMAYHVSPREQLVHQMWGSDECLLFMGLVQVDRLILSVNFERRKFNWCSVTDICTRLGHITHSQFVDCCILSGFSSEYIQSMQWNTSPVGDDAHGSPLANALKQEFKSIPDTARALQQLQGCNRWGWELLMMKFHMLTSSGELPIPDGYTAHLRDQFMKIKNLIHHHVVISSDGTPVTMSFHNAQQPPPGRSYPPPPFPINNVIPFDLDNIIGPKLPVIVYYLLSGGYVGTQVLDNIVHNVMVEYIPNIDSQEYRDFLQKIVPLRTQIAFLLSTCLAKYDEQYWKAKTLGGGGSRNAMDCIQWHMDLTPLNTPPELYLDDWELTWTKEVDQALKTKSTGDAVINFKTIMRFNTLALKSVPSCPTSKTYNNFQETVSVILLKTLDLLGYFTHPQQQHPIGKEDSGKSLFAEALDYVDIKFAEHGLLFIELLRTSALTASPIAPPSNESVQPGGRMPITPIVSTDSISNQTESSVLLLTRVFSLLPCTLEAGDGWQSNKINRDVCAFHVLVRSISKTLRNLSEVVLTVLLLENRMKVLNHDPAANLQTLLNQVVDQLPFGKPCDTALGLVMYHILQHHQSNPMNHNQKQSPKEQWEQLRLATVFPNCTNPRHDLQQATEFWHDANRIVEKLAGAQAVAQDFQAKFQAASKLLQTVSTRYGFNSTNKPSVPVAQPAKKNK
eukprot:TRINITY_DN93959_c0_g1_i1.p1 TRINITY_DN93959_c0_g1~~TRINITY_DN93959_c0_g1_i1.p1  ORF type:complete len:856 (-),score=59.81 TRINITY_DN93959_c0_g1_i1:88-2622(-)